MTRRRAWTTRLPIVLLLAVCGSATSAHAAVPAQEIVSVGPLTSVTLGNDLQLPALRLRPELREVLRTGSELGALGALVSGSGPTLCRASPPTWLGDSGSR